MNRKPIRNRPTALRRKRPRRKVASHENTWTPVGIATARLAPETSAMVRTPSPAVNM